MNVTVFPPIPIDTVKAARAVFGRTNSYLATGDQINNLFNGIILEDPPRRFQMSAHTLAMLYLITFFQYGETLPDHLAADALRERVDWKYALHLPLNYPGLNAASLCEFRKWLQVEQTGRQNLQILLLRLSEITDFGSKGCLSPDSSQVISSVCQFSRLAIIWEALNQALEALAISNPDWLLAASLPHWYERYGAHHRSLYLRDDSQAQQALAQTIGDDGLYLLEAIAKAGEPKLAKLNEVLALREVWREQFESVEGKVSWRKDVCVGCSIPGRLLYPVQTVHQDK